MTNAPGCTTTYSTYSEVDYLIVLMLKADSTESSEKKLQPPHHMRYFYFRDETLLRLLDCKGTFYYETLNVIFTKKEE